MQHKKAIIFVSYWDKIGTKLGHCIAIAVLPCHNIGVLVIGFERENNVESR
jgi:hypothetical protein